MKFASHLGIEAEQDSKYMDVVTEGVNMLCIYPWTTRINLGGQIYVQNVETKEISSKMLEKVTRYCMDKISELKE